MPSPVTPIPTDRPRLSAYLTVRDGAAAIAYYQHVFGAVEEDRFAEPNGRVGHADLRIGDATLMLSDEYPDYGARSPDTIGGSPVMLHLYVEDADAVVARAVAAGAKLDAPVEDQFYGDRGGKITDPFGHRWWIATRKEEVPLEEQKRRASELYGTV
jgi:PhnB protein